jgi:hypothetical protein
VHHRRGDRIGAQRQPADRLVPQVPGQVEHDPPGQRRHAPVEQDPAQVDVPVGVLTRGEDEIAADDGHGPDRREEFGAIAHGR